MSALLVAASCAGALGAGSLGFSALLDRRAHAARLRTLHQSWRGAPGAVHEGLADVLLARVSLFDLRFRQEAPPGRTPLVKQAGATKIGRQLRLAGMPDVGLRSAAAWRLRTAGTAAIVGGIGGFAFTPLAAAAGLAFGAWAGWASLPWALGRRIEERTKEIESHISQAIEVLCLGLRAGLSFERSLELYCTYFPTRLAAEFASARQMWNTGLATREEALRRLADSYDSAVFNRVVEAIVRSLRFGSPLAGNLEELAHEARGAHRARVEEAVMKAPVKMMLPIGLLILPSMMLLVMGPVMLELIEGF